MTLLTSKVAIKHCDTEQPNTHSETEAGQPRCHSEPLSKSRIKMKAGDLQKVCTVPYKILRTRIFRETQ